MKPKIINANSLPLKLAFGSTIKRVRKHPKDISQLTQLIQAEFPQLSNIPLCVQYVDSEQDVITVTTTAGLEEAYFQLAESNKTSLKLIIKIESQVDPHDIPKTTYNLEGPLDPSQHPLAHENFAYQHIEQVNKEADEKPIHKGIACEGCKTLPITGALYRCSVCPDCNICEACEAKEFHSQHILLKIVSESQLQAFDKIDNKGPKEEIKEEVKKANIKKESKEQMAKKKAKAKAREAMATLLGDSTKELVGVPGEVLILDISYDNLSEIPWPAESHITRIAGNVQFDMIPIPERLKPGERLTLSIPIELPQKVGNHKLKLRLKGQTGYFGKSVLILVKVMKEETMRSEQSG